eukprot:193646-Chlamydomonas_euryale.AAC.1
MRPTLFERVQGYPATMPCLLPPPVCAGLLRGRDRRNAAGLARIQRRSGRQVRTAGAPGRRPSRTEGALALQQHHHQQQQHAESICADAAATRRQHDRHPHACFRRAHRRALKRAADGDWRCSRLLLAPELPAPELPAPELPAPELPALEPQVQPPLCDSAGALAGSPACGWLPSRGGGNPALNAAEQKATRGATGAPAAPPAARRARKRPASEPFHRRIEDKTYKDAVRRVQRYADVLAARVAAAQ